MLEELEVEMITAALPRPEPAPFKEPCRPSANHGHSDGSFESGSVIAGRYRIIARLGRGGMGVVYWATDLLLGQPVALKFLPKEAAQDASLLERFHGEVRVARKISHANVCRVYDIGVVDGIPFISMEYVDGEDLAVLLQRIGRLPVERALQVARNLCSGVAAAHAKGVIHRDLKPANIMMNKRGEITILDFGLAAIAQQISGTEALNGTPAYMAPEQLKGLEVSIRSDVYALGLILYELFTGVRPFEAKTVSELMKRQQESSPANMTEIAAELDPSVEELIRRCLDPEPGGRPESAAAVLTALPGGDPLQMALASGRTPSPELVAAAVTQGKLPLVLSASCLGVVLMTIALVPILNESRAAFFKAAPEFPPAALQYRAHQIAADFGFPGRAADSAIWLGDRFDLERYLYFFGNAAGGNTNWKEWLTAENPIAAIYRESPQPMVARPLGQISTSNPPLLLPGMVQMTLDGGGRLRGFSAVTTPSGSANAPVSPETVFRAAAFDPASFTEIAVPADLSCAQGEARAWKGLHPRIPKTELILETCSSHGQVSRVKLIWPWMHQTNQAGGIARLASIREILEPLAIATGGLVAIFLAFRNYSLRRADLGGAVRVAGLAFVIRLLQLLAAAHVVQFESAGDIFGNAAAQALLSGSILFVIYLALEPEIRARWPHAIITWKRFLAGRLSDAQLCGDILKGAAIGAGIWCAQEFLFVWTFGERLNTLSGLALLNGTRDCVAGLLQVCGDALKTGLTGFFLISALRAIVRIEWLAALIGALVMAALQNDVLNADRYAVAQLAVNTALFAGLFFVLLRLGMMVAIAACLFFNTIEILPLGLNFTSWYAPTGVAMAFLIAGGSVWLFVKAADTTRLLPQPSLQSRDVRISKPGSKFSSSQPS